ncbi:hypothetical protein [Marinomonas colpomeniae]|uniref:Nuclear transport factor 2 family protein n=1 Tax=Marinomonas colpomeniae TaxID=2774408 RepID=A0ABR8P373_9GAMM|nr:hypothetical protein [Marinomonas colpomeniae]MBD5772721.1 hypothetical protein [Marinomonas colpomeniae]
MTESSEERLIAEQYLKEMLRADDEGDFDLYIKHFEEKYLVNFSKETFLDDIESMHVRNGLNLGYEFLGTLRNFKVDNLDVFRFVWKGVYEKRDAVIEIGIYKKNDIWYVIQSSVH